MRGLCWLVAVVLVVGVMLSGWGAVADELEGAGAERVRGMTVSCFRNGRGEWDGPEMGPTLTDLQGLGVNAVATHPYARIGGDGSVGYRVVADDPMVLVPAALAKRRGMALMLKPHLAYWRSPFAWRGEITFNDEASWARFFEAYRVFILHQAELAERGGVTLFVVGTELQGTVHREASWRALIAEVRGVYSGRLTYAANWDVYEEVPFWDALDVIGVQAYFPLSNAERPRDAELRSSWGRVMERLRLHSAEQERPVLFTELGYAPSVNAAREPWLDEPRGEIVPEGEELKRRCLRIALEVTGEAGPWFEGVYLWKWFPTDRVIRRNFVLQYPEARALLSEAWRGVELGK
ncbi:MAG: glycoside hydrolase TIM-barrel-like domain-containing protein [Phycisphaeraceae bacterium]